VSVREGLAPPAEARATVDVKERVRRRILGYRTPRAIVALSGGVDSSLVTALAAEALGRPAVLAVTALSPSYPEGELEAARDVAAWIGVEHRTVLTGEVDREAYARNDELRCFHCKTELYSTLRRLVAEDPDRAVLAGANLDDLDDVRPGLLAARQQGVRNPLLDEAVGKEAVRAVARAIGLPVADKPALACLSSRVATGLRITPELLHRIDLAEQAVRVLGFPTVRVRHRGSVARVEVEPERVARLLDHPRLEDLEARIRDLGWESVEIDRAGYRQGAGRAAL
jgi:uncharacterized protein